MLILINPANGGSCFSSTQPLHCLGCLLLSKTAIVVTLNGFPLLVSPMLLSSLPAPSPVRLHHSWLLRKFIINSFFLQFEDVAEVVEPVSVQCIKPMSRAHLVFK